MVPTNSAFEWKKIAPMCGIKEAADVEEYCKWTIYGSEPIPCYMELWRRETGGPSAKSRSFAYTHSNPTLPHYHISEMLPIIGRDWRGWE